MKGTKRSAKADDDDDIWDCKSLKRIRKSPKLDKSARTRSAAKSKSKQIVIREDHKGKQKPIALDIDSDTDDSDDCKIVMSKVVNTAEKRRKSFLTSSLSKEYVNKSMSTTRQTEFSVLGDNSSQTLQTKSPQSKKPQRRSGKKIIVSKETVNLVDKNQIQRKASKKRKSKASKKLVKQENKGNCPFCQVPFVALLRLSPNAHTMECMDIPLLEGTEECQDGDSCHSRLPSHYRTYKHTVLAQFIREQLNIRGDNNSQSSSTLTSASDRCNSDADHHPVSQDLDTAVSARDISQSSQSTLLLESLVSSHSHSVGKVKDNDDGDVHDDEGSDVDIFANVEEFSDDNRSKTNIHDEFEQKRDIERDDLCHGDNFDGGGFIASESHDDNDKDSNEQSTLTNAHCNEGKSSIDLCDENTDDILENEIDLSDDSSEAENDNLADEKTISDDCDTVGGNDAGVNNYRKSEDDDVILESCSDLSQSEQSQDSNNMSSASRIQTSISNFFTKPWRKSQKTKVKPQTAVNCNSDIRELKIPLPRAKTIPDVTASKMSSSSLSMKRFSSDVTSKSTSEGRRYKKLCPFYKKIPDTSLTVDAFNYGDIPGCKAYVLTHFHADHYGGMTRHFAHPVYCSKVTGNLVQCRIKVNPSYIHTLPMNEPCVVEDVELTLMEANHCPGAVIILFRLKSGQTVLHTGDFRANPAMELYPPLVGTKIHQLYLDTTYCDPSYNFPSQSEVIAFAVKLVEKQMAINPKTLIVCGTYTIGKERVFMAIAEALQSKVCVTKDKKVILDCLEDNKISDTITLNPIDTCVHVLPMGKLNIQNLSDYLSRHKKFTSIIAFQPTGWSHSNRVVSLDQIRPKYSRNAITIYGIPYSEHSSYLEMKNFTQFVQPDRILPTVNNGNPQTRKTMENIFQKWKAEINTMNSGKKDTAGSNRQVSLSSWFK